MRVDIEEYEATAMKENENSSFILKEILHQLNKSKALTKNDIKADLIYAIYKDCKALLTDHQAYPIYFEP